MQQPCLVQLRDGPRLGFGFWNQEGLLAWKWTYCTGL